VKGVKARAAAAALADEERKKKRAEQQRLRRLAQKQTIPPAPATPLKATKRKTGAGMRNAAGRSSARS